MRQRYTKSYSKDELIRLWNDFSDTPIDDNDEICEQFMEFEVGTNRFEIWKWFDKYYSGGVVMLIADAENWR